MEDFLSTACIFDRSLNRTNVGLKSLQGRIEYNLRVFV